MTAILFPAKPTLVGSIAMLIALALGAIVWIVGDGWIAWPLLTVQGLALVYQVWLLFGPPQNGSRR